MSYLVLARKWRPQTFEDVVGQQVATKALANALSSGRIHHAFLFTDEAGSSFRMDSWLRPIDQLMRMYWGAPLDDASALPPAIDLGHLTFPINRPGSGEVAGVTADKIRFFPPPMRLDRPPTSCR